MSSNDILETRDLYLAAFALAKGATAEVHDEKGKKKFVAFCDTSNHGADEIKQLYFNNGSVDITALVSNIKYLKSLMNEI